MADLVTLFSDLVFAEVRLFDMVEDSLRSDAGMETSSYLPLLVVSRLEDARVQDVARHLGISVGGASKAVDRLERASWVRRRSHPTDRRSSTITLTAAGRRQLTKATRVVDAAMSEGLTLSATRTTALAGTVAQLRRNLTP